MKRGKIVATTAAVAWWACYVWACSGGDGATGGSSSGGSSSGGSSSGGSSSGGSSSGVSSSGGPDATLPPEAGPPADATVTDTGADASDAGGDSSDAQVDSSDGAMDAAIDADAGPCGPSRLFGAGVAVGGIDGGLSDDYNMKLSLDELHAYYSSDRSGDNDIYYASRASAGAPFDPAVPVTPLNLTPPKEYWASADEAGLLLVLERDSKLYVSTRAATTDPWGTPAAPPELDLAAEAGVGTYVGTPHLTADGATLYFASNVKGSWDIYRSARSGAAWTTPTTVDELNGPGTLEWTPSPTADGLTIYFGSNRGVLPDGGAGDAGVAGNTIWVAHRASTSDPFGAPHKVAELDLGRDMWPSWISQDSCRLYYSQKADVGGVYAYRTFVATQQ